MLINELGPRPASPPYNQIFQHFGVELNKLCEERESVNKSTYVEMPAAEKEICDFTRSNSSNIGVIVGPKGIGKTSVLGHLKEQIWPKESCAVIPLDLKSVSFSEELSKNDETTDAKLLATLATRQHLQKEIDSWVQETINEHQDLFQPCMIVAEIKKYGRSLISPEFWIGTVDPEKIYEDVARKHGDKLRQLMFFIALRLAGYKHVKIIVDNLDDKDWRIVMGFAEALAHLSAYIDDISQREKNADDSVHELRLTPIIACRPVTYWRFNEERARYCSDWYGIQAIRIDSPSNLATVLRRRYDHYIAGTKLNVQVDIGTKPYELEDRDRIFRRLCTRLDEARQADLILQLSNQDMADAMSATLDVFRNRHFVDDKCLVRILTASEPKRSEQFAKGVLSRSIVFRCLAYGNQSSDVPYYPIEKTQVPNIICDQHSTLGSSEKSLLKPSIISLLLTRRQRKYSYGRLTAVKDIEKFGEQFLNVDKESVLNVLDEMYNDKLISHPQAQSLPSESLDCEVECTPRVMCLWEGIQQGSLLIQAYRESTELPDPIYYLDKKHSWHQNPAYYSSSPHPGVLIDMCMMAYAIWQVESPLLTKLQDQNNLREYFLKVGNEFLSERIVQGVVAGLNSFWKHEPSIDQASILNAEEILSQLKDDFDQYRKKTELAGAASK